MILYIFGLFVYRLWNGSGDNWRRNDRVSHNSDIIYLSLNNLCKCRWFPEPGNIFGGRLRSIFLLFSRKSIFLNKRLMWILILKLLVCILVVKEILSLRIIIKGLLCYGRNEIILWKYSFSLFEILIILARKRIIIFFIFFFGVCCIYFLRILLILRDCII